MEVITVFILLIGFVVSLAAFFTVFEVFFADRITKTATLIQVSPGRAALVGIINLVFFFAVALTLFAVGNWLEVEFFGGLGFLVLIPPLIGIVFGLGGVVRVVSERLFSESLGYKATAWGALSLALACALPFIGWFALLPYVCLLGLGALILSFFRARDENLVEGIGDEAED